MAPTSGFNDKKRSVVIIGLAIALGLLGLFLFFRTSHNWDDVQVVTTAVGKHYLLPFDETPALATVEDKSKLTSEFLRSAENGDKMLIYKNAKKVILYRPSIDRIIEVGPVSIADAQP